MLNSQTAAFSKTAKSPPNHWKWKLYLFCSEKCHFAIVVCWARPNPRVLSRRRNWIEL